MKRYERTVRLIEDQLEKIDGRLENARQYVATNVNVRGRSQLHFDDWRGRSGHPLWMTNVMIPRTLNRRANKEKALRDIENKAKDKNVTVRTRASRKTVAVLRELGLDK
jgi:hypothetical protein